VIIHQLAVRAKHKGGTRANPDDWIMKVKKFFPRFARTDRHYTPLCTAFRSASPTDTKLLPTALHSISTPPFNIPRSAPAACRHRLPLTQQSRRMFNNFPPGCPPLQKKLCTALFTIIMIRWLYQSHAVMLPTICDMSMCECFCPRWPIRCTGSRFPFRL